MYRKELNNSARSNWDYWVLRFWRDTAAITLFIVAPVVQVILTRWLPLAILLAVLFLLVGHAMTGFRQFASPPISKYLNLSNWPGGAKLLALAYLGFLAWLATSLMWSPLPVQGIQDIAILIIVPPITLFLGCECSKTTILPFWSIFLIGVTLAAGLLILEMMNYTDFWRLGSPNHWIHDWNRNAVVLAMFIGPILLTIRTRPPGFVLFALAMMGSIVVIYLSVSESAKLMLLLLVGVWLVASTFPGLHRILFLAMSVTVLAFPLLLNPIDRLVVHLKDTSIVTPAVTGRLPIWKGYRNLAFESPIVGFGLRANRHYGSAGAEKRSDISHPHPHNFAMEFWSDLGVIGVFLFAMVLTFLGHATKNLESRYMSVVGAVTVAGFSYSMTGAGLLQGWWIAAMSMVGIAIIAIKIGHIGPEQSSKIEPTAAC